MLDGANKAVALNKIGMAVIVRSDGGNLIESEVTTLPWQLGHGAWVVGLKGVRGGFDCARVEPAPTPPRSVAVAK